MLKTLSLIITTAVVTAILTLSLLGFYVWKYNPMNMKAYLIAGFLSAGQTAEVNKDSEDGVKVDNPLLSADQESMLEKAGISVESLPTSISPELEDCFIEKLGEDRVKEIKAGDVPGPIELFRAKGCL